MTVPIRFSDVRVGLNLGPKDPWTRELKVWEPREGYFVETTDRQSPPPKGD